MCLTASQLCDLPCNQTATLLSYQKTLSRTRGLQGMENLIRVREMTACEMAEDRAAIWELKMERIDTHLCHETGERTGHKSQREQPLRTGTQPAASVLWSQLGTLKATKSHFTPLPNLAPPHTPASTAAPAAETPARFQSQPC